MLSTMNRNDKVIEFSKPSDASGSTIMNASHRCDACGAQAHNIAIHEEIGNKLMFCNHHMNKNISDIIARGFRVERHLYSSDPGTADTSPAGKQH